MMIPLYSREWYSACKYMCVYTISVNMLHAMYELVPLTILCIFLESFFNALHLFTLLFMLKILDQFFF